MAQGIDITSNSNTTSVGALETNGIADANFENP